MPTSDSYRGRNLAENSSFRSAIDQAGLFDDLVGMGRQIAETMTEIFEGLPPGHSLFEQFSFIGAEELPEFAAILRRSRSDEALTREERTRLLSLPLAIYRGPPSSRADRRQSQDPVRAGAWVGAR